MPQKIKNLEVCHLKRILEGKGVGMQTTLGVNENFHPKGEKGDKPGGTIKGATQEKAPIILGGFEKRAKEP